MNHKILYQAGIALVVVGLPFSRALISIGLIWLLVNWFLEGQLRKKLSMFFRNRAAMAITSIFLVHVIWLFNTTDFNYAVQDLRVKLPLLILPLVFSTMPNLQPTDIKRFMYLFVSAVFASTVFAFFTYQGWIFHDKFTGDVRSSSIFISHIRLGLMVSFSIMILIYLFYKNHTNKKPIHAFLVFWMLGFLYLLESFTGFATLALGSIILLLIYTFKFKEISMKILCVVVAAAISGGTFLYLNDCVSRHYTSYEDLNNLATHSPDGSLYYHHEENDQMENGYYMHKHIAYDELKAAWNLRASIPFGQKDSKGNTIESTAIRYMTSKGLHKDRNGVSMLTEQDIVNIENGIPSITYHRWGLSKRLDQLLFELDTYYYTGNPSGGSVAQRIEYWKHGWAIVGNNLALGVGTGDVQMAFDHSYLIKGTKLDRAYWVRAHNQFLTFLITFGVAGFVWMIFVLLYPVVVSRNKLDFYFISFFVIAILSFFWEDTLETQAGVTFFTFFYTLLLLGRSTGSKEVLRPEVLNTTLIDS